MLLHHLTDKKKAVSLMVEKRKWEDAEAAQNTTESNCLCKNTEAIQLNTCFERVGFFAI
jgi:hypothetical protein